jgi:PTS system trehalose-specific IIC component
MGRFTKDATELLKDIGGKENIKAVSHCVTRMRFVLVDEKKADVEKIEAIPSTRGTFTQAGQFQVIIGNDVAEYYNDFTAVAGIEGVSKDAAKQAAKSNQNPIQRLMSNLAEIFAPLIPAIIVGGLILGFRNVIDSLYIFGDGTQTLVQTGQFWAGLDKFLWLIGEAVFHTGIPIGICWSVQKKMGGTEMLGIVLGLTLVSGQLVNAYSVAGMAPDAWAPDYVWDFGFATARMIGYQAQVIPARLAAFTLAYLERFFNKITPSYVKMIVVPFCSLLLAVMAAHFILGPIGWTIGTWISNVVYAGISGNFRIIFAILFGFFYAPLVITGLHHMSNAIDLQLIADTPIHGTMLWPMIALSNIAQGSAVWAMSILQKKNSKAQEVNIPSAISCWLGVTEPAMFGVNLKYEFPFYCAMTGSAIAAAISVGFGVNASAIGVGGIPGFLSIMPQFWGAFFLAMAVAIVVPFVLTLIIGKKKLSTTDKEGKAAAITTGTALYTDAEKTEEIAAPVTGKMIAIEDVEDKAFSSKAMGDGFAIEPTNGKVVAPFSGEVTVAFPTGHAYGIKAANGHEVLIHIGMDTVELNGKGFHGKVKQGDVVHQGDVLTEVDLDYIRSQGKSTVTPVILTDGAKVENLKKGQNVTAGETGIAKIA